MSLADINAVLTTNGKAAVTDATKVSIDPATFAKDNAYAKAVGDAKGQNSTDLYLKQLVDAHPEIGINPAEKDASRKWILGR